MNSLSFFEEESFLIREAPYPIFSIDSMSILGSMGDLRCREPVSSAKLILAESTSGIFNKIDKYPEFLDKF